MRIRVHNWRFAMVFLVRRIEMVKIVSYREIIHDRKLAIRERKKNRKTKFRQCVKFSIRSQKVRIVCALPDLQRTHTVLERVFLTHFIYLFSCDCVARTECECIRDVFCRTYNCISFINFIFFFVHARSCIPFEPTKSS